MKYCNKCDISIKSNHDYCPLCHQTLEVVKKENVVEKYPEYQSKLRPFQDITKKILMFMSVTSIIGLLITNYFTGFDQLWSLIPIGSIVYFWLLMTVGIFSKHNIASKLFVLTMTLIFFVYMIDELSFSAGWALDYVAPILLLSCNIAISFIILIKRINYRDYISYLLLIVLFSIAPIILIFTDVVTILWPALASLALAIFILLFIIFFFPKSIKDEIKKRFHA
ncbi:MAG: DUF6320 domain-containing protein [Tenericutes bacterium]|jgi:hypothetical protein|nr:DUF6320 domain-containing protein [Mycoplasmatota bacterium]